ncbi:CopG family transcriptional regulator [Aliarcobacter cryaerophilus]|uniref:CopG family transcriptional regulator n=1 Tax=Aliarcobacter cryaerophilus TaxID=28198 RepID=UPI00082E6526|nr:CopG family transcriptional regulator [Aliarcobacter cryaerophilus]
MLASKNTKILVSMPQKLSDEVTEFAKELNQNKSALINQALEFYFDHLDLQIAKKRSLEKNETISLSQIRKLSDEQI